MTADNTAATDASELDGDVEQVLRQLDAPWGKLPVDAIRAAQRLKTRIVPGLISLVRRATQHANEGREPKNSGHFFALFLLIEFQASEAWPAILEAVARPGRWPSTLFGDAIHEALPQAVMVMANDRIDEVVSCIRNREIDEFVRWSLAAGLALCAVAGKRTRDEIVTLLRELLREAIEQQDEENAEVLAHTLMELYPQEAYQDIQQAFEKGLIDEGMFNLKDVDRQLEKGPEATLSDFTRQYRPIEDTVETLKAWAMFSTPEQRRSRAVPAAAEVSSPSPFSARSNVADTPARASPRVGRNDPCPCGSGRKFKKCCYRKDLTITPLDRAMAIELVEEYVENCDEQHEARKVFCGDLDLDVPAMTDHFRETSDAAFLFWFAFDYPLKDGSYLVNRILKVNPLMSAGERRYLEQMRRTAMMPYEVIAVRPGESVVLRRLGAQKEIEVREKSASKTLKRWDMLVARLNPLGPTGGPEIEMGAMLMPPLVQKEIAAIVHRDLDNLNAEDDVVNQCKELGEVFHQIWLETIVAPRLPRLVTAEGDPVVFVTMRFDVLDEQRVRSALNAEPSLECEDDTWRWVAGNSLLGTIQLAGSQLTFETQSEPRADRGRQLIERIAQDAIAYRGCDRVDVREAAEKAIRSGERPEVPPDAEDEIPPEVKDQLFQEFMAKHNQQWLDDRIPALDQQTPRFAAQSSTLRPRLVGLLKDMENAYLRALAAGEPAFDPTWMWDELGLSEHQDAPRLRHPLCLAHESMEQHLPGIAQVVRSVAEPRCADGPDLVRTAVTQDELLAEPQVQELMRVRLGRLTPGELLSHLEFYSNYEMQRRKTFWIDESLAWMLAHTQVDAESRLFRLPFPSYVLVYTDRHTLGVAERALAGDRDCPLRGQMLAVLCAYVLELAPDSSRVKVGLTFDAFAGQPPHLMSWELHVAPSETLEKSVSDTLARAKTPAAGLFRPLLDAVINATLYTTSAGINVERYRVDRSQQPERDEPEACLKSGSVYYLPGKIKISHMRKLQQVARGPSGRTLMHRFLVRGHWRRPNPNWKVQSLRWIEPYWRGPSLASIIEREYRVSL